MSIVEIDTRGVERKLLIEMREREASVASGIHERSECIPRASLRIWVQRGIKVYTVYCVFLLFLFFLFFAIYRSLLYSFLSCICISLYASSCSYIVLFLYTSSSLYTSCSVYSVRVRVCITQHCSVMAQFGEERRGVWRRVSGGECIKKEARDSRFLAIQLLVIAGVI